MCHAKISLQWKIVKPLGAVKRPDEILDFFKITPNRNLFSQFSIPWSLSYVPSLLEPRPKFHSLMASFLKKTFDIDLKQNNFNYLFEVPELCRKVSLSVSVRLYPGNILALTINLISFEIDDIDITLLIKNQQLDKIPILRGITHKIIDLIEEKVGPSKLLNIKPFLGLYGISTEEDFERHFEQHSKQYVGLLIRNLNYKHMPDTIVDKVLDQNKDHNQKTVQEKLLINAQGVLYLTNSLDNKMYSEKRIHDLVEVSLVYDAFLKNVVNFRKTHTNFSDFLTFKIIKWIESPGLIFSKSYSNLKLWELLLDVFHLTDMDNHLPKQVRSEIDKKMGLFENYADTRWWEDSDFEYVIDKATKNSSGFSLEFLSNDELEKLIIEDYNEAKRSLYVNNYKSAILIAGSIVEAILTAIISRKEMYVFTAADYNVFVSSFPHAASVLDEIKIEIDDDMLTKYENINRSREIKNKIVNRVYIDPLAIDERRRSSLQAPALAALVNKAQTIVSIKLLYERFVLSTLVELTKIMNLIRDKNIYHYVEPIKNFRNCIHPGVQIRDSISIDENKAKIAIETVDMIIHYLNKHKNTI